MFKLRLITLSVLTVIACLSPQSVTAAVTFVKSQTLQTNAATPHTNTFGFLDSSDTVFLVAVTYEAAEQALTSVTLDPGGSNETVLSKIIFNEGPDQNDNPSVYTAIFGAFLDEVSAGDLDYTLNTTTSIRNSVSAFQLAGATLTGVLTDTDGTYNSQSNPLTAQFTGLPDGSFVLTSVAAKKAGIAFSLGGSPTQTDNGASGSEIHHQAYSYTTGVSGNLTRTWTGNDSSDATTLAAVAIAPIPEPASLALMGLGGLMMLGRSRRSA